MLLKLKHYKKPRLASDYASNGKTLEYSSPDLAQMCQKASTSCRKENLRSGGTNAAKIGGHEGEVAQGVHAKNRGRKGRERLAARPRQRACVCQEEELAVILRPVLVFDCF